MKTENLFTFSAKEHQKKLKKSVQMPMILAQNTLGILKIKKWI